MYSPRVCCGCGRTVLSLPVSAPNLCKAAITGLGRDAKRKVLVQDCGDGETRS
jgi:hypothetical protein